MTLWQVESLAVGQSVGFGSELEIEMHPVHVEMAEIAIDTLAEMFTKPSMQPVSLGKQTTATGH